MNTMEITKIVGGLCSALLALLLIKTGAEAIVHTGGGHGGEEHAAYVIEVPEEGGEAGAEEEPAEAEVPFAELMAAADPAAGERQFRACAACHKLEDGANGVGPHLYGVVGREIAAVGAYAYSDALAGKDGVWDPETLSAFLEAPRDWAPGTKMSYNGMRSAEDRADLIAYLDGIGG